MLGQVVGPHKALAASATSELFVASVCSQVALQFVAARETLAAQHPAAGERTAAVVPTQVRLQVRRFAVRFAATGHVTQVNFATWLLATAAIGALASFALARQLRL